MTIEEAPSATWFTAATLVAFAFVGGSLAQVREIRASRLTTGPPRVLEALE